MQHGSQALAVASVDRINEFLQEFVFALACKV